MTSTALPELPPPLALPAASVRGLRAASREWPTWIALIGCYGAWLGLLLAHRAIGPVWAVPAALLVAFHSSLQHEMLHGHPTRSRAVNEALVFPALGLFVPYRRFRDLHVRHHRDERLTDPFDDPESWYLGEGDWSRAGPVRRALLSVNRTLAGRVTVGPALALAGLWRSDLRAVARGEPGVARAWLLHLAALAPTLAALTLADVSLGFYAAAVAYPGMSILMVRTFVEHRAAERVGERTAVVEAGAFAHLLFLGNNLHAVHHLAPSLPWFELRRRWRETRAAVIEDGGAHHLPDGYLGVARRWLFVPREPVVHPFAPRERPGTRPGGGPRQVLHGAARATDPSLPSERAPTRRPPPCPPTHARSTRCST